MRDLDFRYVCKHDYNGFNKILIKSMNLCSIEDCYDITEYLAEEFESCSCCFNESQNHCDCDSILDRGEFSILSRDQFTGRLDKNGVKIFEGDTTLYLHCSAQGKINAEVVFNQEMAAFAVKWVDDGVVMYDTLEDCDKWFEVIGNSHEGVQ